MRHPRLTVWMAGTMLMLAAAVQAQPSQAPKNLQYFPADIARGALIQRMREFSFALGVRCQYCHAGGADASLNSTDFASDDKPTKRAARFMLRMVDRLNTSVLADMPGRSDPPVRLDCVHCHRGSPTPRTLASELSAVIASKGPDAAVSRYRELREGMVSGRFDFGEWSINELARSLSEEGKTDAAIAMLEMNAEYYPKSVSIDLQLAGLHRGRGEREKAIARYRMALEKDPSNATALRGLKDLGGGD